MKRLNQILVTGSILVSILSSLYITKKMNEIISVNNLNTLEHPALLSLITKNGTEYQFQEMNGGKYVLVGSKEYRIEEERWINEHSQELKTIQLN